MKASIVAIATATVVAAPTLALADSLYQYGACPVAPYGAYPIAPYGDGVPSYSSRYGTYPSYTYDPDPRLRSQLRSDFNRGVDFPGNGR